jgi:hypothetical protein
MPYARYLSCLLGIAALWLGLPTLASAQVNGAIYTSVADASAVNKNIYPSKDAVYLNGGPQTQNDPGLRPDGLYYFQVTDPSGSVLLSTDPAACRLVIVSDGRVVGVPPTLPAECTSGFHAVGTANPNNGQLPVQLMPYNDTPNPGGEYKAWLTPFENFSPDPDNLHCSSKNSNVRFGFCDSDSKTDNFKVRLPNAAYVGVCKFNDLDADGQQDAEEPLIPHWPIVAEGVDGGPVHTQTADNGCVSFVYSGFGDGHDTQVIVLSEGTQGEEWSQTAPVDGIYGAASVTGGAIRVVVRPGDDIDAPNFGNVRRTVTLRPLVVTTDANPSLTRTYAWSIAKSVDRSRATSSTGAASFAYQVTVGHDAGLDSAWQVTGTIRVSNPNATDVASVTVGQAVDNSGSCAISGNATIVVPAGSHVDLPYACTYASAPAAGSATATASWGDTSATGAASIDFSNAAVSVVDGSAGITDTLAGSLGTLTYLDSSPTVFSYALTFEHQPAGTCTPHANTAAFTTNSTGATASSSQAVEVCVGADLSVSKSAATSFSSTIEKSVNQTLVQQGGGVAAFTYTVRVVESAWTVFGTIAIANPNDWQDVSVGALTDTPSVPGAVCDINGGAPIGVVARGATVTVAYSCLFAAAPPASSGINSATVSWDASAFATPSGSASGTAPFAFSLLTISDTFDGVTATLGTLAAASGTFTYARTVNNAAPGLCRTYANTATIVETSQSASTSVIICNTATGAHTIGFWQNKNGQSIITSGAAAAGVCASGTWLRQFAPFQDLAAGASCAKVASYATTIIKAADARGAAMNAMLKAQMLATALDVYFSDAALGGNRIGAGASVGGVIIDLQAWSAAFGAPRLTVGQMLTVAASQSNAGGSLWYGNVKIVQELAKSAFDAINNQVAPIAP